MNNIYQLVIENDNFYETKEFDSYLFENEEDAIDYMRDLMESYKLDFVENYDCKDVNQLMNEYLEVTRESDTYVNWYIEDDCNIEFYIQEKPILKFK
jgi:hypothetical protein